jgi:NADH dehydrogenase
LQIVLSVMNTAPHQVVILGGGFGGLYAAQALSGKPVQVTLVDKRNFHLFQPLLYQVATGALSPGDIASPLRAVLSASRNVTVLQAEARAVDAARRRLFLDEGELPYDTLIVATGANHYYFGNDAWERWAPSIKTIEDALEVRRRIFSAFEAAERDPAHAVAGGWLHFVVIGAGPTGVEMAGQLAELSRGTLRDDFRRINPAEARITLIEGASRVLPGFPEELSRRAERQLARMGVRVRLGTRVTGIEAGAVTLNAGGKEERVVARTMLWAAGVKGSEMGRALARAAGAPLDHAGRVIVQPDLTLPGHPELFVIGDLAALKDARGRPVPGMAPAAMQQGEYAARTLLRRLAGKPTFPFRYRNKGMLAVVGRNSAVADLGWFRFSGFPAWFIWAFVHIRYLVEFDNKLLVMVQWAWTYLTRRRSARLITGEGMPFPEGVPVGPARGEPAAPAEPRKAAAG